MENNLSLLELFSLLQGFTGYEMRHTQLPWRESDQTVFVANYHLAEEKLHWRPMINKNTGVAAMLGLDKKRWSAIGNGMNRSPEVGAQQGIARTIKWIEHALVGHANQRTLTAC